MPIGKKPAYRGKVDPSALPAGEARREAEKSAADELAEEAQARGLEAGAIHPKAFRIENEIASRFNELEVTDAQPEYEYCWVQAGYHGRFIKMKQAQRVEEDGGLVPCWEVVQGDMPEALEVRGLMTDTTRRLGDVILMRCKRDRALKLRKMQEARRAQVERGITSELEEMGQRLRGRGVIVHTTLDDDALKRAQNRAAMRLQASQMIDGMLRDGSVPGLGVPGTR